VAAPYNAFISTGSNLGPPTLRVDPVLFEQVLFNVFDDAAK
jgi:K+-sensing histidine kinase KdpD